MAHVKHHGSVTLQASLNTDMAIEQSGLCETFQICGIALALLVSFTSLAMQSPSRKKARK